MEIKSLSTPEIVEKYVFNFSANQNHQYHTIAQIDNFIQVIISYKLFSKCLISRNDIFSQILVLDGNLQLPTRKKNFIFYILAQDSLSTVFLFGWAVLLTMSQVPILDMIEVTLQIIQVTIDIYEIVSIPWD